MAQDDRVQVPSASVMAGDNESHDANAVEQQLADTQETLEETVAEEVVQDGINNAFSSDTSNDAVPRTDQEEQDEDEDMAGFHQDRAEEVGVAETNVGPGNTHHELNSDQVEEVVLLGN
ncbi:hypothetical protein V6N12_020766 [Hibiscus sabdariffa]|uniref:Uncharacterized protein n=1 Tax=Hibiscus sabdariffa TaxID=183260 RepID=A0ABR2CZ14_9ROSI